MSRSRMRFLAGTTPKKRVRCATHPSFYGGGEDAGGCSAQFAPYAGLEHFSVACPVSLRARRIVHTVFALAPWAISLKNALFRRSCNRRWFLLNIFIYGHHLLHARHLAGTRCRALAFIDAPQPHKIDNTALGHDFQVIRG